MIVTHIFIIHTHISTEMNRITHIGITSEMVSGGHSLYHYKNLLHITNCKIKRNLFTSWFCKLQVQIAQRLPSAQQALLFDPFICWHTSEVSGCIL